MRSSCSRRRRSSRGRRRRWTSRRVRPVEERREEHVVVDEVEEDVAEREREEVRGQQVPGVHIVSEKKLQFVDDVCLEVVGPPQLLSSGGGHPDRRQLRGARHRWRRGAVPYDGRRDRDHHNTRNAMSSMRKHGNGIPSLARGHHGSLPAPRNIQ
jgi:hypothetical protein